MDPMHDVASTFNDNSLAMERILSSMNAASEITSDPMHFAGANNMMGNETYDGVESSGDDVPMTFPQKLIEILGKEELSDIISWLPHGKGFFIYKKKRFALEVLPKYWKQAKFTSFTRKLNRWGYTRVTRGPETGAYYHKLFQRGNLRLCLQMSCQPTKQAMLPSLTYVNESNMNMLNVFAPPEPDLAQQSEIIIQQQLHQLHLQQMQLQQLQYQQQQLQAADMMRAHLANGHDERTMAEDLAMPTPMPNPQHLEMYQMMNNLREQMQQQQHQSKEDYMMSLKADANSLFLQSQYQAKDSWAGLMGGGPIALLPALGAEAFNRPPMMMEQQQDGAFRPSMSGNGRAWAA